MTTHHPIILTVLGLCLGSASGCSSSSSVNPCGKCADTCVVSATTPVGWSDQTSLGSPEQHFSPFAGTCQAPFHWDASGWGSSLTVVPVQGTSTLTATVVVDSTSARLLTHAQGQALCPDVLEIDGVATLDLPEGKVADHQPFTLSVTAGLEPGLISFVVKEADIGAWVSIKKPDPASTLSMSITVGALARGCSGQVGLSTQVVHNGVGNGGGGPLGSWSNGGAP